MPCSTHARYEELVGVEDDQYKHAVQPLQIKAITDDSFTVAGYGVVYGGTDLENDTFTKDTNYMLGVANDLETRKNALIKDGRNIGFIETGQEAILKSTGKYDMDAWYKWAVNKRLDFTNIEIISSAEAEMLQNLDKGTKEEALVQYSQLYSILNRYGDKKSHGYNVAYKNMYKNLDNKYKTSFSLLVRDGSFNPSKIKRIWDYGKLDILKTKSNKLGED